MANQIQKDQKQSRQKKAAATGMVTKSGSGGSHAKGSSFMVNKKYFICQERQQRFCAKKSWRLVKIKAPPPGGAFSLHSSPP
jgi:hypothetical protein